MRRANYRRIVIIYSASDAIEWHPIRLTTTIIIKLTEKKRNTIEKAKLSKLLSRYLIGRINRDRKYRLTECVTRRPNSDTTSPKELVSMFYATGCQVVIPHNLLHSDTGNHTPQVLYSNHLSNLANRVGTCRTNRSSCSKDLPGGPHQ